MRCIWSAIQNQDITMSDPKSWFPSSICRFLAWLFYTWSASLSSTRYPWHLLFPTFFREFLPKCQQGFAWNCHNFPPPLTKKKVTGNRFVLLWGRSAKFFRSEIAKLSWENAGKYPLVIAAAPARTVVVLVTTVTAVQNSYVSYRHLCLHCCTSCTLTGRRCHSYY